MAQPTQPDPAQAIWGETISTSPDIADPGSSYTRGGWPISTATAGQPGPPRGYMNFILKYLANGLRWMLRRGVNDWTSGETYLPGDIVRDTTDNGLYIWSHGSNTVTGGGAPSTNMGSLAWQLVSRTSWARFTAATEEILAYRTFKGHRRFGFDHMGFDAGQIGRIDETWDKNDMSTVAATSSATNFGNGWTVTAVGASGGFCQRRDPTSLNASNHVAIYPATTATSTVVMSRTNDSMYFDANRHIALRFDNFMEVTDELAKHELAFGLFQGLSFPFADVPFSTLAPVGVGLVKRPGDSNWQFYTKAAAGSPVYTDSGKSGYSNRCRIGVELQGANVSDNGNSNVLLTIDYTGTAQGKLEGVAAIGAGAMRPLFHAHRATSGSAAQGLVIGPTRIRWNTNESSNTDEFP